MVASGSGTGWRFDQFQLLPEKRLLLANGGTPVPLTSKAFDTLVFLVENRDRVVAKDELLRAIWPEVIVEEGNLTQQVFLLRKALGESAQQPRYIVTVPGHGYRFTATVQPALPGEPGASEDSRGLDGPTRTGVWRLRKPLTAVLLLAGLVVSLGVVVVLKWRTWPGQPDRSDRGVARVAKITETGKATAAAIAPDGRNVAYIENEGEEYSLYVQPVAGEGRTQVVPRERQVLTSLTFSRDGKYVYFARGTMYRGGFALYRVPTNGGTETPVLDNVDTAVSFSPGGGQFAFMRGAGSETQIVVADVSGGGQRVLAARHAPFAFWFVAPAWSPDGTVIAASMTDRSKGGRSSIVLLTVDGGSARELYAADDRIGAVRWLPDGSGLLTVVSESLARQFPPWQAGGFTRFAGGGIWRIGYPDGKAERLTFDLTDYDLCCVDVGGNPTTVAGVLNTFVSDLWIAPADRLDAPRQVSWGTPVVMRHGWLPDSDTVVYRDLRGRLNAVRKDGRSYALPLPEGHKVAGGVSACGDGRFVVFQAVPGNQIWRVPPAGGGAVRLTEGAFDSNPVCSADGRWVVYSSMRENVASTWRVSIEGGAPAPLVPGESYDAVPSPSGRFVYYSAFEWEERPVRLRKLKWVVIDDNRKRHAALDAPSNITSGTLPNWAPDESGLDYIVTRNGVSNIWRLPLDGTPALQISHFSVGRIFSFAWSPDRKWLSLASGVNRSDVTLITGAR